MTTHVFPSLIDDRDHTIASQVSRQLRDAILRGELQPAGRINLARLGQELGVSGSPLREALSRLIAENLVEFEDNRGYRVSEISRAKLAEISLLRPEIEPIALRHAIPAGKDKWDNRIIAARHRLNSLRRHVTTSALDLHVAVLEVHRAFLSQCPLSHLVGFLGGLQNQHLRYLYASRDLAAPSIEELDAVVAAVLDRDADTACQKFKISLLTYGDAIDRSFSAGVLPE